MQHFGIYSPVLGERKDIPHIFLNKVYTPDSKNVQMWDGKVRTSYARSNELLDASGEAVRTPDGMPVLNYLEHLSDSGGKSLLAFTSLHAYRWDPALYSWTDASGEAMFNCSTGTTVTEWSAVSFNGKVIATNNVDVPQVWDGNLENKFTALNASVASGITITRAKTVIVFESHVVFGNFDTSDSEIYPNDIAWSDLDDETAWEAGTGSDAGAAYVDGEGAVSAFGIKNDLLYAFKGRSARVFWYTGTDLIFSSRPYAIKVGTFAQSSVVNDDRGNLYFYGSDLSFREVDAGEISAAEKPVVRNINQEIAGIVGIKSVFIDEYKEVWWAVPTGTNTTNNTVLCFKDGIWYSRDISVSAFGKFSRTVNYSWDNQPAGAWDDWTGAWDDASESSGWIFDICGDYYGYTYTSHSSFSDTYFDGSGMSANAPTYYFVMTTDLSDNTGMRFYKRLLYLYGYFTNIGGSPVNIYIKQDSEPSWNLAGTMDTAGTNDIHIGELPVDCRGRTFLVKIESTTPFEFLGMEFDYLPSGDR